MAGPVIEALRDLDADLVKSPEFERLLRYARSLGLWPELLRPEWQLITSVPKDGTAVLLYGWVSGRRACIVALGWWVKTEYVRMEVVRTDYDEEKRVRVEHRELVGASSGYWAHETKEAHGLQEPTHWMPLPTPPPTPVNSKSA